MFIAADVGGTTGKVAAYAARGSTEPLGPVVRFAMTQHDEMGPGDFEEDFKNLLRACRTLAQTYGTIEGVGLAVAGKLDPDRTTLVMAGNLAHWVGEPLRNMLVSTLRCAITLGNDAEAAVLAEVNHGVGRDFPLTDMLGMIWGTGVGGACVRFLTDGTYISIPAEPGHVIVGSNPGVRCRGCEDPGHLEAYCGGAGLPRYFDKSVGKFSNEDWKRAAELMVLGLKSILSVQPVSLITFSGGVACKQAWLLPRIEAQLSSARYGKPTVRLSAFGESAGLLGALSLLTL